MSVCVSMYVYITLVLSANEVLDFDCVKQRDSKYDTARVHSTLPPLLSQPKKIGHT